MSSDGGDGDETIYGFLPGSIESYVSHTPISFFLHQILSFCEMCIYYTRLIHTDESTAWKHIRKYKII